MVIHRLSQLITIIPTRAARLSTLGKCSSMCVIQPLSLTVAQLRKQSVRAPKIEISKDSGHILVDGNVTLTSEQAKMFLKKCDDAPSIQIGQSIFKDDKIGLHMLRAKRAIELIVTHNGKQSNIAIAFNSIPLFKNYLSFVMRLYEKLEPEEREKIALPETDDSHMLGWPKSRGRSIEGNNSVNEPIKRENLYVRTTGNDPLRRPHYPLESSLLKSWTSSIKARKDVHKTSIDRNKSFNWPFNRENLSMRTSEDDLLRKLDYSPAPGLSKSRDHSIYGNMSFKELFNRENLSVRTSEDDLISKLDYSPGPELTEEQRKQLLEKDLASLQAEIKAEIAELKQQIGSEEEWQKEKKKLYEKFSENWKKTEAKYRT